MSFCVSFMFARRERGAFECGGVISVGRSAVRTLTLCAGIMFAGRQRGGEHRTVWVVF